MDESSLNLSDRQQPSRSRHVGARASPVTCQNVFSVQRFEYFFQKNQGNLSVRHANLNRWNKKSYMSTHKNIISLFTTRGGSTETTLILDNQNLIWQHTHFSSSSEESMQLPQKAPACALNLKRHPCGVSGTVSKASNRQQTLFPNAILLAN